MCSSVKEARQIAVIAGSGLGGIGRFFQTRATTTFDNIEGLGACTVEGHQGEIRFCAVGDRECVLVLGRRHVYEGGRLGMDRLIRWLADRVVTDLVVVSAAGGLKRSFQQGDLVVAKGIVDLQNLGRLHGGSRGAVGSVGETGRGATAAVRERGLRENRAGLSRRLTAAVERAAREAGVAVGRGTLACCPGPAYESSAEVRALLALGADVATMSSAPEVLFAGYAGLDVAVIAAVTNQATGIGSVPFDHSRVLEVAEGMSGALSRLLKQLIKNW